MGAIADVFEDLDSEVPEAEFREAVAEKVETMGGLADEETAAMLVAHELDGGGEIEGIADVEPGMEEVKFLGKVTSVGELRTFERDDESEGRVLNVEVADETGRVRVAFWDERAEAAAEELETGTVLRIAGRPKEGYDGVEVNADRAEPDDAEIEVDAAADTIAGLSLGQSGVSLVGLVLDTDSVRTFERDDGSEGRVANLALGDDTGRTRVTLWDAQTERAEELESGDVVEVVDGYVREREGDLELHVGERGAIEEVDAEIEYSPETTPIDALEIDTTVDIAGVVRSADPKRTFERDDGSEGQVRNIRVQDATGDVRVALWGEKADREIGPADEVQLTDVEIQDGWQDDLEASAGWRSALTTLDGVASADAREATGADSDGTSDADGRAGTAGSGASADGAAGLDSFAGGGAGAGAAGDGGTTDGGDSGSIGGDADGGADAGGKATADGDGTAASNGAGEPIEFTGTVVQAGEPVVLDDGTRTVSVETATEVRLGQKVTARGPMVDGRLDAEDVL
ncbi:replication factor A [Halobacteriales archaeon QS_4_69_34]|nr:MAG: replication factor A [Halobacteriales archaeon QS_4_69_34]